MLRQLAIVFLVLIIACGGGAEVHPTAPPALDDVLGSWELENGSVGGAPVQPVAGHPITLIIEPGQVGGSAGCNGYGGRLILGPTVSIIDVASTAMACEPAEVMDTELAYTNGLLAVDRMTRQGDKLLLAGPDVDLVFRSVSDVDPTAFVDIEWTLIALGPDEDAPPPGGELPTLVLTSGRGLVASTGCRELEGAWTTSGPEVLMTRMSADGECPADLAAQDSTIISVLGDGFRPAIVDGDLVLTSMGGETLRYRR